MNKPPLTHDEYERRFKDRIVDRLTPAWSAADAHIAAEDEYEAWETDDYTNPERDADECLSYWDDDGDNN